LVAAMALAILTVAAAWVTFGDAALYIIAHPRSRSLAGWCASTSGLLAVKTAAFALTAWLLGQLGQWRLGALARWQTYAGALLATLAAVPVCSMVVFFCGAVCRQEVSPTGAVGARSVCLLLAGSVGAGKAAVWWYWWRVVRGTVHSIRGTFAGTG